MMACCVLHFAAAAIKSYISMIAQLRATERSVGCMHCSASQTACAPAASAGALQLLPHLVLSAHLMLGTAWQGKQAPQVVPAALIVGCALDLLCDIHQLLLQQLLQAAVVAQCVLQHARNNSKEQQVRQESRAGSSLSSSIVCKTRANVAAPVTLGP